MTAKQFGFGACVGLLFLVSAVPCRAQPGDGDPALSRAAAAKNFPRLLTQWNDLDRKLTTVGKALSPSDYSSK